MRHLLYIAALLFTLPAFSQPVNRIKLRQLQSAPDTSLQYFVSSQGDTAEWVLVSTIGGGGGSTDTLYFSGDSGTPFFRANGDTLTIAGAGIASTSASGSTITVTATEVDGSTTNELGTVSSITYVPDTTSLTPKAGDAFINATADTLGLYSGTGWVLFYGGGAGDNLGNHTMTQNLQTDGNWISGDGGNEGIQVDASGKVGIGVIPSFPLEVNGTGLVLSVERQGATSNSIFSTALFKSVKTTAMADGFGSGFIVQAEDDDAVANTCGIFGFARDGADNSYGFRLVNYRGGSAYGHLTIDADGKMVLNPDGPTGGAMPSANYTFEIDATDAMKQASGTTAQRPTNIAGGTRYNTSNGELEYADGSNWWGIDPTQHGSASGTTDGSGDITVSHGFGTASITVNATPIGTTYSSVMVHSKTTTNFKIRFFDSSGAAQTATSVAADWIAKKQ